ncbi:MAG: hypothetical protein ACM3KE_11985, partial [Hyphomicrobiales bacterium]
PHSRQEPTLSPPQTSAVSARSYKCSFITPFDFPPDRALKSKYQAVSPCARRFRERSILGNM